MIDGALRKDGEIRGKHEQIVLCSDRTPSGKTAENEGTEGTRCGGGAARPPKFQAMPVAAELDVSCRFRRGSRADHGGRSGLAVLRITRAGASSPKTTEEYRELHDSVSLGGLPGARPPESQHKTRP